MEDFFKLALIISAGQPTKRPFVFETTTGTGVHGSRLFRRLFTFLNVLRPHSVFLLRQSNRLHLREKGRGECFHLQSMQSKPERVQQASVVS